MPVESQARLEALFDAAYHKRVKEQLRQLVTRELIEEQIANPLGQPSDARRRLLNYLGNLPIDGKLITEHDGNEVWYVCRLVGSPPVQANRVAGPFETQHEALEVVFRQRLSDVFGIDAEEVLQ